MQLTDAKLCGRLDVLETYLATWAVVKDCLSVALAAEREPGFAQGPQGVGEDERCCVRDHRRDGLQRLRGRCCAERRLPGGRVAAPFDIKVGAVALPP